MAYNNGFPVGYQYVQPMQPQYQQVYQQVPQTFGQTIPPQNTGFQPMQQQYQQVPQQNQQSAMPAAIHADWVQGQAGANAYNLLKPGEKAFLFDSDSSCFYVKIIDADGKPQPLKVFDYQERGTTVVQPAVVPQVVPQPEPQPLDDMKDAETVIAMRIARMMEQEGNYSRGHYVRGHYSNDYSGDGYSGNRSYGYSGNYSGNRYSNGMENDGMYMSNGSYGNYSGYRGSNGSYRGYSRDDAQERMRQQLERMMGEAQSDQVREALQGALSRMG